eukprot:gene13655-18325_t
MKVNAHIYPIAEHQKDVLLDDKNYGKSMSSYLLFLPNSATAAEYFNFHGRNSSFASLILFQTILSGLMITIITDVFQAENSDWITLTIMCLSLSVIITIILVSKHYCQFHRRKNEDTHQSLKADGNLKYDRNFTICIESVWAVVNVILMQLAILFILKFGNCSESKIRATFSCNNSIIGYLPGDSMTMSLILPLAQLFMRRTLQWRVILFCYVLTLVLLITTIFHFHLFRSIRQLVPFTIFNFLLLFDYRKQNIRAFYSHQKEMKLTQENERIANENNANEMRHMIGNVAHDLKTPLTAFTSGMELISSMVEEIKLHLINSIIDLSSHYSTNRNSLTVRRINTDLNTTVEISLPTLSILIVDDAPTIVKMTGMMLSKQGHKVMSASDGAEALEKVREFEKYNKRKPVSISGVKSITNDNITDELLYTEIHSFSPSSKRTLKSFVRKKVVQPLVFKNIIKVNHHHQHHHQDDHSTSISYNAHDLSPIEEETHQLIIGVSANSDSDTMQEAFRAGVDAFMPKPFSLQTFHDTYLRCYTNYSKNAADDSIEQSK